MKADGWGELPRLGTAPRGDVTEGRLHRRAQAHTGFTSMQEVQGGHMGAPQDLRQGEPQSLAW